MGETMNGKCIIITARMEGRIRGNVDIEPADLILCADGGWAHARAEHILPDVLIGDFDSFDGADGSPESLADSGGKPEIIRLPQEKDDTDTMACVRYGIRKGYERFVMVGGLGGRFDHSFANIQTLSYLTDMGCEAWIIDGLNRATMLAGKESGRPATLRLPPLSGSKFSIFSYEERCVGVNIRGAAYLLNDALLTQSFPIGVSNAFLPETEAIISVALGRLLIILSQDEPSVDPSKNYCCAGLP
jgi:thiamine pyrophosphokinase